MAVELRRVLDEMDSGGFLFSVREVTQQQKVLETLSPSTHKRVTKVDAEAGCAKGMSFHLIFMRLKRFLRQEEGATLVEYAMLAVLISISAVTLLAAIGLAVRGTFQGVIDEIEKTKAGG